MQKKKVIILGGGISGLALRYYLSQYQPNLDILLFEKENRLGGVIESLQSEGFFFEKGPRTFKASKSLSLLTLISELGMEQEILVSEKKAARRFIWKNKRLHALPTHPYQLLVSPLTRKLIPALLTEWYQKKGEVDESIHSFVERRLGTYAAEVFFDPMTLGIYAGDIHKLSIVSCFPLLKALEQKYGSMTKGLFKQRKENKKQITYPGRMHPSCLFTLRDGVESLVSKLEKMGSGEIWLNSCIDSIQFDQGKVCVTAQGKSWEGDHLFCALSAKGAYHLIQSWDENLVSFFHHLELAGLNVLHLGYDTSHILKRKGFGYLIPSNEKENILGVIFDSSMFPQQNRQKNETRLTVMMRGTFYSNHHDVELKTQVEQALAGLKRHLGITTQPVYHKVSHYPQAIPQFTVGHQRRITAFRQVIQEKYPQVTFLGNYLDGVSINDCIASAKAALYQFNI